MAAIPTDRPFYGRDLEDFRRRQGMTVDDACFMCGITKNRWFFMVNTERDLPLRDVPLSIMCRLIDKDPSLSFVPTFTEPTDLLETISASMKITKREFSVMLGNNGTSANRWTVQRKRASPPVHRLSLVIKTMIERQGMNKAVNNLRNVVENEALQRGIPDVFTTGRWTIPKEKAANDDSAGDD
ncbi:MAG: hypothetical protein CTY35_00450 [Methylotenera sp.]|uniref:hypothetical protein n=1 Tax=Methylotenera sp. TaxID=2051956 RepID=UPI000D4C2624|nr:hypothetical protein [Methylotenera sp.]PPC84825.1 MAG: hypothetical protein CTY38_00445 [Methylotenera sp.]PPD02185.1 MAG: hypothetical protein CTY35_00450 [Methylotenera sp.]